jgi:hypothetical protein
VVDYKVKVAISMLFRRKGSMLAAVIRLYRSVGDSNKQRYLRWRC